MRDKNCVRDDILDAFKKLENASSVHEVVALIGYINGSLCLYSYFITLGFCPSNEVK